MPASGAAAAPAATPAGGGAGGSPGLSFAQQIGPLLEQDPGAAAPIESVWRNLASGRVSGVNFSTEFLANPDTKAALDALVTDGALAHRMSSNNPNGYSLAGRTVGIVTPARANRPQVARASDAARSSGFEVANAAVTVMGGAEGEAPLNPHLYSNQDLIEQRHHGILPD